MLIRLTAKTNKARNRIAMHGANWFVLDWHSPIRKDSWFVVSSLTSDKRWIKKTGDENFNVEVVEA